MKKVLCGVLVLVLMFCTATAFAKEYTDKETVKKVQLALNYAGYYYRIPDGIADIHTIFAIRNYQSRNGMKMTGIIDDDLLASLGLISTSSSQTSTTIKIPPNAEYYSTNTKSTVKNGNSGIYAYRSIGKSYDIYWIIDFDAGYVYYFPENGSISADRVQIVSGDLNSVLIITYHDGADVWSYGLHFSWKNQPNHLVVQDQDGFTYDYYPTDLSAALQLLSTKTIYDY